MKKELIHIVLLLTFVYSYSQQQTTQLIPEFSLSQPLGYFSQDNFGAKQGFGGGLHIDRLNIWKGFGLGLYAGYTQNESEFKTPFPNDIDDGAFRSRLFVDAKDLNWSSLQFGLGPIYNLKLSNKFNIQAYSKFGIAKVSYPEYRYYVIQTQPIQQEYTLFETSEPENLERNFNFMALSGLRLNYSISNRIGLSLGVNYLHVKGLTHIYTTRNVAITGNESSSELFDILLDSEETTKTYECNINSINGTIGIVINIGGNTPNEDSVDEEPDIPIAPDVPVEEYDCGSLIYESPGYNTPIILEEKSQIIFQWADNNERTIKDDKAYQLIFFIKEDGKYKEIDRRTLASKKRFKIGLSPNKPYPNNELFWQIIPVDTNKNEFCPEPAKLMRILVFKNQEEANEKLPECLIQTETTKKKNTDAFRKN